MVKRGLMDSAGSGRDHRAFVKEELSGPIQSLNTSTLREAGDIHKKFPHHEVRSLPTGISTSWDRIWEYGYGHYPLCGAHCTHMALRQLNLLPSCGKVIIIIISTLIDVAIPADRNVVQKEAEKK